MQAENELVLRYAGVPVRFPYRPYRAQNALMHGVITAANNGSHALLESPTGTGKSLALLCSALAWQQHIAEKIKEKKRAKSKTSEEGIHVAPPPVSEPAGIPLSPEIGETTEDDLEMKPARESVSEGQKLKKAPEGDEKKKKHRRRTKRKSRKKHRSQAQVQESGSDADFQEPIVFRDTAWQKSTKLKRGRAQDDTSIFGNAHLIARFESWERDAPLDISSDEDAENEGGDDLENADDGDGIPRKVPRIFYAARTHNQVTQVVDELRKTSYRPALTVLASRREYCIRPEVRQLKNRNDVCKGLLKARQCSYYHKVQDLVQSSELMDEVWDIEELNNVGKRIHGCPYYASAELYKQAEIIFCPYNYIVDKTVRESSGINIKGDIILFDEAHNIENHARESASFSMDVTELRRVVDDLNDIIEEGKLGTPSSDLVLAANDIIETFVSILRLTDAVLAGRMEQDFDTEFKLYEGEALTDLLNEYFGDVDDGGVGLEASLQNCRRAITLIRENHDEEDEEGSENTRPDGSQQNAPPQMGAGFGYQTTNFGLTAAETRKRRRKREARNLMLAAKEAEDEFGNKSVSRCLFAAHKLTTTMEYYFANRNDFCLVLQRRSRDLRVLATLNLWCLNSAVCFRPLSEMARSVIVTSGTLSPLRSFAGELGTQFNVEKSLPHVINVRKQLYVGVVARGPDETLLDATYTGSSTFQFQDSLGAAIESYCRTVPSGVLVFFPSYRMLETLRSRWQISGMMDRLSEIKGGLFFEPRGRGDEFEKMMSEYYEYASSPEGAVLFGVCRGKLAEGIDFRDQNARAVIIVGIPFPHNGDLQVKRKKAWNNRARATGVALLPGSDWYEIQGYRALNQALGRTIRHRHDFGSILLLDHRYRNPDVLNQLPGWTREAVLNSRGSHQEALSRLTHFFANVTDSIAEISVT